MLFTLGSSRASAVSQRKSLSVIIVKRNMCEKHFPHLAEILFIRSQHHKYL